MRSQRSSLALLFALMFSARLARRSRQRNHQQRTILAKVIIDTDIGDDIDDAFAVDIALVSPELRVLGISAAWGDTALRGRMCSTA